VIVYTDSRAVQGYRKDGSFPDLGCAPELGCTESLACPLVRCVYDSDGNVLRIKAAALQAEKIRAYHAAYPKATQWALSQHFTTSVATIARAIREARSW
jgi:hypothetical protein